MRDEAKNTSVIVIASEHIDRSIRAKQMCSREHHTLPDVDHLATRSAVLRAAMCKAAALMFMANWMEGVWGTGGGKST